MPDLHRCDHGVSLTQPCADCELLDEIEEDAADDWMDDWMDDEDEDTGDYEEGGEA